jgi:nitroreductase
MEIKMNNIDFIKSRRSVRKYKSTQVKKEDIITILETAHCAPSAMNQKPWEFLVITGEKILIMGEIFLPIVEQFASGWKPSNVKDSITRDEFISFSRNYGGAPVVIIVLFEKQDLPNFQKAFLESASAAMENLLLAATALGLGTCWMTGPLIDETALRKLLDIPESKEIVAVTPLGYPVETTGPVSHQYSEPELQGKIRWIE